MAKGNEIGTFSHRSTSATLLPGPGGGLITQVNFEGEATSFGTVADNGSFESVGPNRWKTSSIWRISNGSALLSEGEIDLASRAWSGKNYEWN